MSTIGVLVSTLLACMIKQVTLAPWEFLCSELWMDEDVVVATVQYTPNSFILRSFTQ